MANEKEVQNEAVPVDCKWCKKTFKSNSILKHLTQTKKKCLSKYSENEIALMKDQSKKLSKIKEKQWKNKNENHIIETSSKYYQKNKEQIRKKRALTYAKKKELKL